MKALSKVILMQKKFKRLEREILKSLDGHGPCLFRINDFSPEFTQVETDKRGKKHNVHYQATIEVTFENWSTSHYSVRVSDMRWIPEGHDLDGKGLSGYEVLREQLKELKQFQAHRDSLKTRQLVSI